MYCAVLIASFSPLVKDRCVAVWSVRKNGLFLGNKRIILAESAVVSRGLVRPCFAAASQMRRQSYDIGKGHCPSLSDSDDIFLQLFFQHPLQMSVLEQVSGASVKAARPTYYLLSRREKYVWGRSFTSATG